MPPLARVHHERRNYRMIRPVFFYLRNLAEIGFRRAITNKLDVIEARHARRPQVERRIPRRDIDDRIADGLPNNSTPSGLESAMALVTGVRWRTRRDPKRIRGFDAGEVY